MIYYNNVVMKKILSILIILSFVTLPAVPCYAEYDFSDEAQEEFNRAQQEQLTNPRTKDYSRARRKRQVKPAENNDRNNYVPNELLYDESAQQNYAQPTQTNNRITLPQYPDNNKLYGSVVQVPSGTSFDVTFDSGISSGSLEKNDRLTVRLTHDLTYNGQIVAPSGSLVYGTAENAENAGYAYGSGSLALNFNQILTPNGEMLPITTRTIIVKAKSERAVKMSRDILVGALGSMLVGAAFTALGGSHDWGKSMAIYGGIGALGGGIHGAMQRGNDVQIPDGTTIKVTLTDTLNAQVYK